MSEGKSSADEQRDLNIARLFTKIDNIRETVINTRSEVGVIGTKVDDFSFRLRKLEERDEKHAEREEKFSVLATKLETIISNLEPTMKDLTERVSQIENTLNTFTSSYDETSRDVKIRLAALEKTVPEIQKDLTKIKNNWGWVVAILAGLWAFGTWLVEFIMNFRS